jgi:hypothetical protein
MSKQFRWLSVALVGLVSGCSDTPTTPTPTNSFISESKFFSGTLVPSGTSTAFTFTTSATTTVAVTVASLRDLANAPMQAQVTLNLGTVSGSACSPTTTSRVVQSTLTSSISASLPAGTYCVSVADAGMLGAPTNFTVRVTTSIGTAPTGTETTNAFPTKLAKMGTSMKTFEVGAQGAVAVTLTSIDNDFVINLALGVWDGADCRLHTAVVTGPGTDPQITVDADAGLYCVRLADIGNLTTHVNIGGVMKHQ